jgi:hypothetical protein
MKLPLYVKTDRPSSSSAICTARPEAQHQRSTVVVVTRDVLDLGQPAGRAHRPQVNFPFLVPYLLLVSNVPAFNLISRVMLEKD